VLKKGAVSPPGNQMSPFSAVPQISAVIEELIEVWNSFAREPWE